MKAHWGRRLLSGVALVLAACSQQGGPFAAALDASPEAPPRATDASTPTSPGAVDAGPEARELSNVIERDDLGADWSCTDSASCTADYERFLGIAAAYGRPLTQAALDQQLWALQLGQVDAPTTPLAPALLRDRILDALNIRVLVEGILPRPLTVTTTARKQTAEYDERELLFFDPYVGTFKGIFLTPKGAGPFPAVVAIHGHPDDATIYRDSFHGREYPAHGYAILMLTMRAMAIDTAEHDISMALLRGGFSLVGMRVYETLLGLKYVRHLGSVRADRVGLIGHSGGSSASNLTVRIESRFSAYVSDNSVDWFKSSSFEPYHCETVPLLYPYNRLLSDFTTSLTPVRTVPYGYASGMAEIFQFFDDHLKK